MTFTTLTNDMSKPLTRSGSSTYVCWRNFSMVGTLMPPHSPQKTDITKMFSFSWAAEAAQNPKLRMQANESQNSRSH